MGRLALAGRPLSGDHGQVDQAATLALLEQGDLALQAPRLGGMARAEGVVIVSERFWAFAGTDGSLREGTMPTAPNSLRAIPLVRGLVRLSASLSPRLSRRSRWRSLRVGSGSLPASPPPWRCSAGSCVGALSTCTAPSTVRSPRSRNGA